MIKCILYTLHVMHYTVSTLFPFYCERITEMVTIYEMYTETQRIFVKDPRTIPLFIKYKKILECTQWILNIYCINIHTAFTLNVYCTINYNTLVLVIRLELYLYNKRLEPYLL